MYHNKGAILAATGSGLGLTSMLAIGVGATTLIIAGLVLLKMAHKATRALSA